MRAKVGLFTKAFVHSPYQSKVLAQDANMPTAFTYESKAFAHFADRQDPPL